MPRMRELIDEGLFGRGLIKIESSVLVSRYNAALVHMGIDPTKLTSFQIDRLGWSPEIAAEKSDEYYLSHGPANPVLIVLTPEQETAPIYFPMHSYDWKLTERWFKSHRTQIAELTKETAVCVDFDQSVELYAVPQDLAMVNEVIVRTTTVDGFMSKAEEQQKLIQSWMSDADSHLDVELIAGLEESAKSVGDLRRRSLLIRDYQFSDVADFYSRDFGGVFVLRSRNTSPLIFVREESAAKKYDVPLADENVLSILIERGYVETSVDWWQDHLYRLKVVAESFLVDVLEKHNPRLDYAKLNRQKRLQLVKKYKDELSEYLELYRVRDAMKKGKLPEVSDVVRPHLLHPSDDLDPVSRELVWQLLTYVRGGRFVPLMYRHQKSVFVEAFTKRWKKPKRSWAMLRVREHYELASKSSGLEL
jgi:hypothetical protein